MNSLLEVNIMRLSNISGIAVATFLTVMPSAFAQTPTQTQPQTPTQTQPQTQPQTPPPTQTRPQTPPPQTPAQPQTKTSETAATQTFTGCLMTEPDYRRAHNLGSGAAGGLGLGDEFVLVNVKISPAKSAAESSPSSAAPAGTTTGPVPASKCVDQGVAYRVTGTQEEKLKGLVNHQLEVQGRFKHADDVTPGAAQPADKLPAEVEIVSFREVPSRAVATEPAPAPPARTSTAPAPTSTTPAPRAQATQPATTEPKTTEPKMPHTASSSGLVALVGVLALSSGLVLTVLRRRAF